jgi:hypothetical protein
MFNTHHVQRRPAPANFDVTSDLPVVADLPDEGEFFLVPVGANQPPTSPRNCS